MSKAKDRVRAEAGDVHRSGEEKKRCAFLNCQNIVPMDKTPPICNGHIAFINDVLFVLKNVQQVPKGLTPQEAATMTRTGLALPGTPEFQMPRGRRG